jgi:hypothetical protein
MTPGAQARRLFPVGAERPEAVRYRVSRIGCRRGPGLTNLPLALAHARAIAVAGHRAFLLGSDGTSVEIAFDGMAFTITPLGPGTWPDLCRHLLERHGG